MIPEILQTLELFSEKFPREALEAAIEQKEEITPVLLETLKNLQGKSQELSKDYFLNVYSFFLLAQFRETQVYPLIIELMMETGENSYDIYGDFITEDFARVLASVYNGDIGPLLRLIETEGDDFVRGTGIQALSILYLHGQLPRQELLNYLENFARQCLENPTTYSLCTDVVIQSIYVHATELTDVIEQLFDANLVDLFFVTRQYLEKKFTQRTLEEALQDLRENQHYQLVNNVIEEMGRWYCFQENKEEIDEAEIATMGKMLAEVVQSRKKENQGLDKLNFFREEESSPKHQAHPKKKAKQKQQQQSRKKNRSKKN